MTKTRVCVVLAIATTSLHAGTAHASDVYSGASADGRARVRITIYEHKAKAQITLMETMACAGPGEMVGIPANVATEDCSS